MKDTKLKGLKIEIRPIPNRGDIRKYSENLEYFSQSHTIAAFVNPTSLKYETGLSDEDISFLKEKGFPYDISNHYEHKKAHPFWESSLAKMELKSTPVFLHPGENLMDFVKYKYLLKSRYIYLSEAEIKEGSKPEATHYIYNESLENEVKATELEFKHNLIRIIGAKSLQRKRQLVLILLNEDTSNKDDNYLMITLDRVMSDKKLARELSVLLEKSSEDITLTANIKIAMQRNILKKTNQGIFYFESKLGLNEADVKEFLEKPENQDILLTILSKME